MKKSGRAEAPALTECRASQGQHSLWCRCSADVLPDSTAVEKPTADTVRAGAASALDDFHARRRRVPMRRQAQTVPWWAR